MAFKVAELRILNKTVCFVELDRLMYASANIFQVAFVMASGTIRVAFSLLNYCRGHSTYGILKDC